MTAHNTALSFFDGGIIIARNIPYKATDNAETTLTGRMLPAVIPHAHPDAHIREDIKKAPKVYSGSR